MIDLSEIPGATPILRKIAVAMLRQAKLPQLEGPITFFLLDSDRFEIRTSTQDFFLRAVSIKTKQTWYARSRSEGVQYFCRLMLEGTSKENPITVEMVMERVLQEQPKRKESKTLYQQIHHQLNYVLARAGIGLKRSGSKKKYWLEGSEDTPPKVSKLTKPGGKHKKKEPD